MNLLFILAIMRFKFKCNYAEPNKGNNINQFTTEHLLVQNPFLPLGQEVGCLILDEDSFQNGDRKSGRDYHLLVLEIRRKKIVMSY